MHNQHKFTHNVAKNFHIIFNFFPHPIRSPASSLIISVHWTEQLYFKDPNWQEANQLAIYKLVQPANWTSGQNVSWTQDLRISRQVP